MASRSAGTKATKTAGKKQTKKAAPTKTRATARKPAARATTKKKKAAGAASRAAGAKTTGRKATTARPAKTASKPAAKAVKATTKAAQKTTTQKTTTQKTTTQKTTKTGTAKKAARRPSAALDKFLDSQRKLLLDERDTYLRQAETLKAEADALAEDMEPGDVQFDEESGEGDTINVERERDLALSAQARVAVEEIDASLRKIDDGTYGICEQCGEPIPRERLKALPYASLCVRCKSGGLGRR